MLYRRFSKDNPYKAIVVAQAKERVLGKHIQDNFDLFKKMVLI